MLVNNKYRIVQEVGKGKFGKVYQAVESRRETKVAIKYDVSNMGMLRHEATMLNYLHQRQCNTKNIPKILWYGKGIVPKEESDPKEDTTSSCRRASYIQHPCLVIPFYDCTLSAYIISASNPDSSSNTIRSLMKNETEATRSYMNQIMIQSMLSILESIHQVFVLHRDLKPENFMMKHGQVYLIDFGLSTFFVDGESGGHVPINTEPKQDLVGSPLYTSIHVHRGYKASRRDDCIQLGYIWLYMALNGHLPWEHINNNNNIVSDMSPMNIQHPKNQYIYCKKQNILEKLDGYSFTDIQDYLVQCYALDYDAKPRYVLDSFPT
jgi:serine/threonine protein kinase